MRKEKERKKKERLQFSLLQQDEGSGGSGGASGPGCGGALRSVCSPSSTLTFVFSFKREFKEEEFTV